MVMKPLSGPLGIGQLRLQLEQTLEGINQQVYTIATDFDRTSPDGPDVTMLRYPSGEYVMVPLLVAKAQVLVSLISITSTEGN